VIICGGFAFCAVARRRFIAETRQTWQRAKAEGTLPPELQQVEMEHMPLTDVGIRVSRSTLRMVTIAHWLVDFAMFLIPAVFVFCVVSFVLFSRLM
jgi:hypothetical protein